MAAPLTNRRIAHTTVSGHSDAHPAALRPATGRSDTTSRMTGPFEVAPPKGGSELSATFVTGLLVIYPAFATMLAIIFGLFLTGRGA
ncbi:hypothetical protein [Manganibacter manganicus]|uniref:Uncharacterized protein n=1 Tax=Manganibacter manganicus TaxID=1873176 RepID=A0A1V8RQ29_9HYPH|nr:hypothetical protein [Pseudaminobacter manganicus]OQM75302.1 hypothetical protein BFN67_19215 [Pseudaminobacter manganicus]